MADDTFSFFDKIYCINLKTRPDRRDKAAGVFDMLGIPVEFHTVDPDPVSGIKGCFESHVEIIEEAYQAGYQNILIFEDDIVPSVSYDIEAVKDSIEFMKKNQFWEMFYFSCYPDILYHSMKKVDGNINNVHAYWGSGYCLSRRGIERYHDLKYESKEIDQIYVDNNYAYCYWRPLFYQDDQVSNLREEGKAYNGGMALNEMYIEYVNIPIVYLSIAIALVLIILGFLFRPSSRTTNTTTNNVRSPMMSPDSISPARRSSPRRSPNRRSPPRIGSP